MGLLVPVRILLVCLLALAALAAPAAADHRPPGEEGRWDDPPAEVEEPAAEEPADEDWPDEDRPEERWPEEPDVSAQPDSSAQPDWPRPETTDLPPLVKGRAVAGRVARMRAGGKAAVPLDAPVRVRRLVSAVNEIVGKPYKWGGGHGSVFDRGYDCSGAVSYGLIRTGLLGGPLVSGGFARWGRPGKGRWVTIYANGGHVYMEIAGLRLDTSSVGDADRSRGVRWRPAIGQRRGFRVRHVAGL